ncbi:hypothetical protein [Streptosporangium sp. G12]
MAWSGSGIYGQTVVVDALGTAQSGLNLDLDTNKLALYTDSRPTPNYSATTPVYITTGEVVGAGYTAGGKVVTGTVLSHAAGIATWDSNDIEFPSSTLADVRGADFYADPLSGDPLILGMDFLVPVSTSDGTLRLAVNPLGLMTADYIP